MGMGGTAGIAGAVGIAAVAVNVLAKHWSDFFGQAEKGPEKVIEVIDIAAERLKKLGHEIQAIREGKSFEFKETQSLISEYLKSGIGEQVETGVAAALGLSGRGEKMTAAERKATTFSKYKDPMLQGAVIKQAQKEADERIAEANRQKAAGFVGGMATDSASKKLVLDLATQYPDLFPKGFVEGMAGLEPEAVKAQDEELEQKIIEGEEAKHNREMRQLNNKKVNALRKKTAAIDKKRTEDDLKADIDAAQDAKHEEILTLQHRKEKIREDARVKSHTFSDTKAYVNSIQEKAFEQIPKAQLIELKGINKKIEDLRKDIKDLGRLR